MWTLSAVPTQCRFIEELLAIKQDMTVDNQGHIFQSGRPNNYLPFFFSPSFFFPSRAPLDLDALGLEHKPLFNMQITKYYIDCLVCLKSI